MESKRGEGLELLRSGLTVEEVSAACGVHPVTVRRGVAKTDTLTAPLYKSGVSLAS